MKKLIVLITTLMVGLSVMAQDYDASNKYGFFSNWTVGLGFDVAVQPTEPAFGGGINLEFDKQLSNYWYMRISGGIPFINSGYVDRYGYGMIGAMVYPWTRGFYAVADLGASFKLLDGTPHIISNLGIGYNIALNKRHSIFVELDALYNYDNVIKAPDVMLEVGYAFRFGPTGIDRAIIIERERIECELLEYVDSLEVVDDSHNHEIQMCKIVMKDQGDLIVELQDSIKYLNTTIDSLWKVVDGLVEYNSAPCVVYNINSYKISKDQLKYVDFIAEMVKDEDSIYVYGYADGLSGSDEYNRELSLNRALALKQALVDRGIDKNKIFTVGKCYDVPVGDSNSAAMRKAIVIIKED